MVIRSDLDVGFPFELDGRGRVTDPDYATHVRQMIELVLFTSPGERVNRPDFGCGLLSILFSGATQAQAESVQILVQSALEKWLGNVISVDAVEVVAESGGEGASLSIAVSYQLQRTGERQKATFQPPDQAWNV